MRGWIRVPHAPLALSGLGKALFLCWAIIKEIGQRTTDNLQILKMRWLYSGALSFGYQSLSCFQKQDSESQGLLSSEQP